MGRGRTGSRSIVVETLFQRYVEVRPVRAAEIRGLFETMNFSSGDRVLTNLIGVNAVVFVIDGTDHARFHEAKAELRRALRHPRLDGATLLVIVNKQDLFGGQFGNKGLTTIFYVDIFLVAFSPTDLAVLLDLSLVAAGRAWMCKQAVLAQVKVCTRERLTEVLQCLNIWIGISEGLRWLKRLLT